MLETQEEALSTMYLFEVPESVDFPVSADEVRAIRLHSACVKAIRSGSMTQGAKPCHIVESEALVRASERSVNGFFPNASVNWCETHNEIVDYFGICPQNALRTLLQGDNKRNVDEATNIVYGVVKRLKEMGIEYSNLDLKELGLVE